jgi:hypothetical protein
MIKIEFTDQQIKELHFERFNHPHPRVQLKMEVLYTQQHIKLMFYAEARTQ